MSEAPHSGAGLGGLAFAIALQKYAPDVEFEIYEGAAQLTELGVGIAMQRRPLTIMEALGLAADLLRLSGDEHRSGV